MDPRTRIVLLLCVGVLAVTLDGPFPLALLAGLAAGTLALCGLDAKWLRRGAMAVLAVVWSTVLSQALFYNQEPRVVLLRLGPVALYEEGIIWGLVQSLRLVAVSLAGLTLALSTPVDRLYAALLRLRVPFGLALMAVTALRFLPELGRELLVVRRARARRGRPIHHRSPWAWLKLEVSLLRPVVARALRRAYTLAESLDARGFDPTAPRAVRDPLVMGRLDWSTLALAVGLTLVCVALRVLFVLYTANLLYLPTLRPVYGFVRNWL